MVTTSYKSTRNFFLLVGAAIFLGWLLDKLAWSLVLVLLSWSALQLYQFRKLKNWLAQELESDPPDAKGEWGVVFDHLYRIRKARLTREKELLFVINRFQRPDQPLWALLVAEQILGEQPAL